MAARHDAGWSDPESKSGVDQGKQRASRDVLP